MTAARYLGKGWAFPVVPSARGGLEWAEGPEAVKRSIRILLDTEPGERVMRPSFGAGLRRFLMRPNTLATRALIRHDVERALAAFEPRIRTTEVSVEPGDDPSLVLIRVAYLHRRDNTPDNLVYPFYLE